MKEFFISNKYLIILILISILGLCVFTGHYNGILIDFGREVYYPEQILQGKVLYKDLFNIYGPLSYQINALLYKLFGINLNTLYIAGSISAIMIVSFVYLIAKKFLSEILSFSIGLFTIIIGITTTSIFNFHFPYSWACVYGNLCFLVSLFFLINYTEKNNLKYLYLSALFSGACAVLKYDFIIYCLVVLFFIIKNKSIKAFFSMLFIPFISVSTLFVQGLNFSDIYNTISIINNMAKSKTLAYFYQNSGVYFHPKALLKDTVLFLKFVIPFSGFLAGIHFYRKKPALFITLSLISLIIFYAFFNYKTSFGFVPILLLISSVILFKKFDLKLKIIVISAISVSLKVFWVLLLNSYGIYYISVLLIGIFSIMFKYLPKNLEKYTAAILITLSAIILFSNINKLKLTSYKISTLNGHIYTKLPQAESSKELIKFIENETQPEDKILILPEGMIINFLTNRTSDNFYNSFLPLYIETFKEDSIIKHFEDKKPEYIILSNLNMKDYYYKYICQDYAHNFCSFILENYENKNIIDNDFRYLIFELKKF